MQLDADLREKELWMNTYKNLAECFLPPQEALREVVKRLSEDLRLISSNAVNSGEAMLKAMDREKLSALRIDHARLFVGPFQLLAPPYGSVYIDGSRHVMGESTINVLELYHEAGMDILSEFNEPPDHIAIELEFASFLVYKQIEAIQSDNPEEVIAYWKHFAEFRNKHFGAWCLLFAEQIKQASTTNFYRELGRCIIELFNQNSLN